MEFDYRKQLREELQARKSRNVAYSMRAYARDLNISLTALHEVLHSKRHFSPKNLRKASASLGWSSDQFEQASQTIRQRSRTIKFDYRHNAIYNLSKQSCPADPVWISRQLGLEPGEVLSSLQNMINNRIVTIRSGQLVAAQQAG